MFLSGKNQCFLNDYSTYFAYLPARLINNCILLPIEAESQDTAYRFEDKKKYYNGYINSRKQEKKGTQILELLNFATTKDDFIEADIIGRTNDLIEGFMTYISQNGLAQ